MLNLLISVLGISLFAAAVLTGVNYLNPDTGRRSISISSIDQEATSLMLAWASHRAATGTDPLTVERLNRFRSAARPASPLGLDWAVRGDGVCVSFPSAPTDATPESLERDVNSFRRSALEGFAQLFEARNGEGSITKGPRCGEEEVEGGTDEDGFAVLIRMKHDA